MKRYALLALQVCMIGSSFGCAPVRFEAIQDDSIRKNFAANVCSASVCTGNSCIQHCSDSRISGDGRVDILIVNDNSGSMSFEQRKLSDRLGSFIQSLGSLDYRIAMVTTDISTNLSPTPFGVSNSPRAINGFGSLQDGNLLQFGSGAKYLDRQSSGLGGLFSKAIVRNETLQCEESGFKNCPSNDERGVFAANLVIDHEAVAPEFIRPKSHVAVIVLSDEDERGISDSRSALNQGDFDLMKLYPLENYDRPTTLVSRFHDKFPENTLSVHSLIVKPGDVACLSSQSGQNGNPWVRGVEGYTYAELSRLTNGTIGSICENDYGSILGDIGRKLQNIPMPFRCRPIGDKFNVQFDPQPLQPVTLDANFSTMSLSIVGDFASQTKISLQYDCPASEGN
jgi:hypothetical protein